MAGAFKLFGVYTALSAWVILAFNCVCSALTVWTTWEIAVRCFNRRVAWWSAWIWTLYPAAMQYSVKWVWEMSLTAFLFSWILVLALRMRNIGGDPTADRRSRHHAALGGLRTSLGHHHPQQRLRCHLPALLRPLDPEGRGQPAPPASPCCPRRRPLCRLPRALDGAQRPGLPPFHSHAHQLRRRTGDGQRSRT